MKLSKIRRYRKRYKFISALFSQSPAVIIGLNLPFLIAASVSLRAAAALSLELLVVHMGTIIFSLIASRHIPRGVLPVANVLISTLLMVVSRLWLVLYFSSVVDSLGIYFYLMAVNGMTLTQSNSLSEKSLPASVLFKSLLNVLGFSFVMFFISLFREYLGNGTLWGYQFSESFRMPGVLVPFFGFIVVGFLLAGTKLLNKKLFALAMHRRALREARFTVVRDDVML